MNLSEKVVYLSGAMLGCTDEECRDWREYAKQHLRCATRVPWRCATLRLPSRVISS